MNITYTIHGPHAHLVIQTAKALARHFGGDAEATDNIVRINWRADAHRTAYEDRIQRLAKNCGTEIGIEDETQQEAATADAGAA